VVSNGAIIAQIGSAVITDAEFAEVAANQMKRDADTMGSDERLAILEDLIHHEVLFQEALRQELYQDFKVKRQLVNILLRDQVYATITDEDFSEEELKGYFRDNQDLFVVPEKRLIKRIFIEITETRSNEAALAIAVPLFTELRQSPEEFAAVALEHSDGPAKRRGGEYGYLPREDNGGSLNLAILNVAFELPVGSVSEPFEARGGLNMVLVESVREEVRRPYEQMRGTVLRRLKTARYGELSQGLSKRLRGNMDIEVNDKLLQSVEIQNKRASTPEGASSSIIGRPALSNDIQIHVRPEGRTPGEK
jgi:parvulin-like peptidyl-prolyl isomerase